MKTKQQVTLRFHELCVAALEYADADMRADRRQIAMAAFTLGMKALGYASAVTQDLKRRKK